MKNKFEKAREVRSDKACEINETPSENECAHNYNTCAAAKKTARKIECAQKKGRDAQKYRKSKNANGIAGKIYLPRFGIDIREHE